MGPADHREQVAAHANGFGRLKMTLPRRATRVAAQTPLHATALGL